MSHVSTPQLHGYRYGELEPTARAAVEAHLQACERCAKRLAFQVRERDAFVLQPVPEAIRAAAAPAPAPWWRSALRWLAPGFGLAAVAAAALLLVRPPPSDGIRTRGEAPAEIEAWVATDAGPRALRPGEALHAGSVVQLAYDPDGAAHVWLAGRDASGVIELYGEVRPQEPDGLQPAPFSLTLDGAKGTQELFVVRSERPLGDEAVKAAVTTDVPPDGVTVSRLAIPKE